MWKSGRNSWIYGSCKAIRRPRGPLKTRGKHTARRSVQPEPRVPLAASASKGDNRYFGTSAGVPKKARQPHTFFQVSESDRYLHSYTVKQLFVLGMLDLISNSKPSITAATVALKYAPLWLVKSLVYDVYCGGENPQEVVDKGKELHQLGFGNMMISYTAEQVESTSAENESQSYEDTIAIIEDSIESISLAFNKSVSTSTPGYIALKPTGLQSNAYDLLKHYKDPLYKEDWQRYIENCSRLCQRVSELNKTLSRNDQRVIICFDAEKREIQDGVHAVQLEMMKRFNTGSKDNINVIGTMQMYLTDSLEKLKQDISESQASMNTENRFWLGYKLVRGAYLHSEPERDSVIFRTKEGTDNSFNTAVRYCVNSIQSGSLGHLVIASHNQESIEMTKKLITEGPTGAPIVFAQLLGMCDKSGITLGNERYKVIKYVPWGPADETRHYLVRRLEENGDSLNAKCDTEVWLKCLRVIASKVMYSV